MWLVCLRCSVELLLRLWRLTCCVFVLFCPVLSLSAMRLEVLDSTSAACVLVDFSNCRPVLTASVATFVSVKVCRSQPALL